MSGGAWLVLWAALVLALALAGMYSVRRMLDRQHERREDVRRDPP